MERRLLGGRLLLLLLWPALSALLRKKQGFTRRPHRQG
jgi:hypothetical protein